jgi:hypothetical protein
MQVDFSKIDPKENIVSTNLKNVDVVIPRKLVVITGLSGSEKPVWPLILYMLRATPLCRKFIIHARHLGRLDKPK